MNKNKKKWIWRGTASLVAVALIGGGLFYARGKASSGTVAVYPVSSMGYSQYGENTTMSGEVTDAAMQEVRLGESLVDKISVKEGQEVKKGDTLMKYNKESVKLTIKSDQSAIALIEAEMESARAELVRYQSLHTSEEMPQSYEEIITHRVDPVTTLDLIEPGTAPSEEGNVYYCNLKTKVTAEMLQNLDDTDQTAIFRIYENDVEIGSWEVDGKKMTSGTKIIYITKDPDVDPTPTPVPEENQGEGSGSGGADQIPGASEGSGQTSGAGEAAPVRAQELSRVTHSAMTAAASTDKASESRREEPGPYEDWIIGESLTFNGDGTVTVDYSRHQYGTLRSVIPAEPEWQEVIIHDPEVNTEGGNYCYTRKELNEMIKEKEDYLKNRDLDLKAAKLKLEQDELLSTDGKVKATMDGVVTEVKDPNETKKGEPLITVKGNSGYTITIHASEYEIASFTPGEQLSVMSYETSSYFAAEVTEVILDPEENGNNYFYGQNVSSYPVIATVLDEAVELHRGEGCEVTRMQADSETSGALVIPAMMVRKDIRGSYCMVADEDNRLKRVEVKTGQMLWGSEIVILSGITESDRIAFPYGKYVKVGSPVVDKDNMYEDY